MQRLDRLNVCSNVVCLALIAMFLVAVTPLPATESEMKAKPAEATEVKIEATGEAAQEKTADEPDTSICIDAEAGQATGVATLEDIYSLSRVNLAALLKLGADAAAETTPAVEEVRWTEVVKTDEPGTDTNAGQLKVD